MPQPWVNSTDGIHLFLTFDYDMNDTEVLALGHRYDYVWGATPRDCKDGGKCDASAWRTASPGAVVSWYPLRGAPIRILQSIYSCFWVYV